MNIFELWSKNAGKLTLNNFELQLQIVLVYQILEVLTKFLLNGDEHTFYQ